MQVMMPRVNEASRIRNDELQRGQAMQQNAVQSAEKQSEDNLKQVKHREETQKTAIRERQERRRNPYGRQGKDAEAKDEQGEKKAPDDNQVPRKTIDIRL